MSALGQNRPEKRDRKRYEDYLSSAEWKAKRQKVLARDGNCCQVCCSHKNLQVHHLTYIHVYAEPLEDLVTWCQSCHFKHHKTDKRARKMERQNRTAWRKKGQIKRKKRKQPATPKKSKWPDIPLRMSMREYEQSIAQVEEWIP